MMFHNTCLAITLKVCEEQHNYSEPAKITRERAPPTFVETAAKLDQLMTFRDNCQWIPIGGLCVWFSGL